jgi:DNA-binding transcriptional LysR family regulator
MGAPLETRHVEAIVALAEELNFTRAASRLNLTQPTLSRQIEQAETLLGFLICDRDSRGVTFTEAGKVVAEECRCAKHHLRLAQHRGMTTHEGTEHLLLLGHSPWIDRALLALMFEIRLPQFPRLKIELRSDVAPCLTRNLLEGEIQVAIMTEPAENEALILTALSNSPIHAVFPAEHPAAEKSGISLADFASDAWAILRENADPELYLRFQDHARASRLRPKEFHQIMTPHEAGCLVAGRLAVAFLPTGFAEQVSIPGAVCRPLIDDAIRITTCTALRRSDDSKLANAFIRAYHRRFNEAQLVPPTLFPL